MPKPPETPPHSDTDGVNRDARVGTPSKSQDPEPGSALDHAKDESKARPKQSRPLR
jgi:hypothetical protein